MRSRGQIVLAVMLGLVGIIVVAVISLARVPPACAPYESAGVVESKAAAPVAGMDDGSSSAPSPVLLETREAKLKRIELKVSELERKVEARTDG